MFSFGSLLSSQAVPLSSLQSSLLDHEGFSLSDLPTFSFGFSCLLKGFKFPQPSNSFPLLGAFELGLLFGRILSFFILSLKLVFKHLFNFFLLFYCNFGNRLFLHHNHRVLRPERL